MLYLKEMLQSIRIIGLLKDLISNWLFICLQVNCFEKAYLSVTLVDGPCHAIFSLRNVAILRKIRVELEVLQAT